MACGNSVSRAAAHRGRGPLPAQQPAQKLPELSTSREVACEPTHTQRPLRIRLRTPAYPPRGDPKATTALLRCAMETTAHTTALSTPATDTLLLTLDEAARELRCARRSLERRSGPSPRS